MALTGPDPRTRALSSLLLPAGGTPADGGHPQAQPAPEVLDASNGASPAPRPDLREEPVTDLLKQVREEASSLARNEVKLAKAELAEKGKEVGIGAGMVGGAGYLAALASLALMLCLIFALATFMAAWLAALIVTVLFAAGAGALAAAGRTRIKKAGPPLPAEAVASVKQTIQTVKENAKWGLNQTR